MNSERSRRVEERAYALWQAEGQPHGRHEEHWHRAEQQIRTEETVGAAVKRRALGAAERKPGGRQAPRGKQRR
jgi:Protein of unknown function (DUF2934)